MEIVTKPFILVLIMLGFISMSFTTNDPNISECEQTNYDEQTVLKQWRAGEKVSLNSVVTYGVEKCFVISEISDTIFERINGKSYKKGCTIPIVELRYLKVLHYNQKGEILLGEIVCNKSISSDLIDIFRALYDEKYPIERMVLVDEYDADDEKSMADNNTSCFNYRYVAGTKRLSNHSMGKAIDINPLYNPMVVKRKSGIIYVSPSAGKNYANRSADFMFKIDRNDLCYKLFKKHGFTWGGDWTSKKDYQHFEK